MAKIKSKVSKKSKSPSSDWEILPIAKGGDLIKLNLNDYRPSFVSESTGVKRQNIQKPVPQKKQEQTIKQSERQSIPSKAAEVLLHPLTAISNYSQKGYIPDNFSKGELNPIDYAMDAINPAFYVKAAGNTLKSLVTPQTYTDIPKTLGAAAFLAAGENAPSELNEAAFRTLGVAGDALVSFPFLGAGAIKGFSETAKRSPFLREQIYKAIEPVGYGAREKILKSPKTWIRNTFLSSPEERALKLGKGLISGLGNKTDDELIRVGKNRLDAFRTGLRLPQKFDTFENIGEDLYRIKNMNPESIDLGSVYSDLLANEVKKLGYYTGENPLINISRKFDDATMPPFKEIAGIEIPYSSFREKVLGKKYEPWEQVRIVESSKNPNFTHSVYDTDRRGIMGSFKWDVNKPKYNEDIHFQSNDIWNLNPWEKRGPVSLEDKSDILHKHYFKPFENIEALSLMGGKPFKIQNNFIVDPKNYRIKKSFKQGGSVWEIVNDIKQEGGNIPIDPMGYWNPDNYNKPAVTIPSNEITMKEKNGKPLKKGKLLGIDNTGYAQMMYPGDYVTEYPLPEAGGGYRVIRSNERKGKTHKVIGPGGTVKFFGDSKLGQHPKDPARKKAFYARHKKNLAKNPYFRAFARKTWAEGGMLPDLAAMAFGGLPMALEGRSTRKNVTRVPFPQNQRDYMMSVGANPKYRNLDSSEILRLYSQDQSTWPKTLDITEEICSEPGKCGPSSTYKVSPTMSSNFQPSPFLKNLQPQTEKAPQIVKNKPIINPVVPNVITPLPLPQDTLNVSKYSRMVNGKRIPITKEEYDKINAGSTKTGSRKINPQDKVIKIVEKQAFGGLHKAQDGFYNMQRALELGYNPDDQGHWPSVDSETGMWLKSKQHPTAWMEYLYGYTLNPEVQKNFKHPVVNPEGYFGENQLQYIPKQAFGGNLILEKYQGGGSKRKKKKQTIPETPTVDMYGRPIESRVITKPDLERSYYDPRRDIINMERGYNEMDPYDKERILAHENYHAYQFKNNRSTYLPVKDIPYQKPPMVATDEYYYGYHNRKPIETQAAIDEFKEKNPSFRFVPDDAVYNFIVDPEQYLNPETFEGEAKFYEDLGTEVENPLFNRKLGGSIWEIVDDFEPYQYQKGGKVVSEIWQDVTGTPWSQAKKLGLTKGGYEENLKLRSELLKNPEKFAAAVNAKTRIPIPVSKPAPAPIPVDTPAMVPGYSWSGEPVRMVTQPKVIKMSPVSTPAPKPKAYGPPKPKESTTTLPKVNYEWSKEDSMPEFELATGTPDISRSNFQNKSFIKPPKEEPGIIDTFLNSEFVKDVKDVVSSVRDVEDIKNAFFRGLGKTGLYATDTEEVEPMAAPMPKVQKPIAKPNMNTTVSQDTTPTTYYQGKGVIDSRTGTEMGRYVNTFSNWKGQEYIPTKNVGEWKKDKSTVYPSSQMAHYLLDVDLTTGFQHTSAKKQIEAQKKGKSLTKGSTLKEQWLPVYEKLDNGNVRIKYKTNKELTKDDKVAAPFRQYKFGDLDWESDVKSSWNKSSSSIKTKTGEETRMIKSGKDMSGYGQFGGGSFVLISKRPSNGEVVVSELSGSLQDVKNQAKQLAKLTGQDLNEIVIAFNDVGSWSAKPASRNKKLTYQNIPKKNKEEFQSYQKDYTGAGLAFPF